MIYLIQYDAKRGKIQGMTSFPTGDRAYAQRQRLTLELDFRRSGVPCEVVLLEAADEESLKRAHQRYFRSPREIVESMMDAGPETGPIKYAPASP